MSGIHRRASPLLFLAMACLIGCGPKKEPFSWAQPAARDFVADLITALQDGIDDDASLRDAVSDDFESEHGWLLRVDDSSSPLRQDLDWRLGDPRKLAFVAPDEVAEGELSAWVTGEHGEALLELEYGASQSRDRIRWRLRSISFPLVPAPNENDKMAAARTFLAELSLTSRRGFGSDGQSAWVLVADVYWGRKVVLSSNDVEEGAAQMRLLRKELGNLEKLEFLRLLPAKKGHLRMLATTSLGPAEILLVRSRQFTDVRPRYRYEGRVLLQR